MKYTIEDTTLTNIANSIRNKTNTTGTIMPESMAGLIDGIEVGGGNTETKTELETCEITLVINCTPTTSGGAQLYINSNGFGSTYIFHMPELGDAENIDYRQPDFSEGTAARLGAFITKWTATFTCPCNTTLPFYCTNGIWSCDLEGDAKLLYKYGANGNYYFNHLIQLPSTSGSYTITINLR